MILSKADVMRIYRKSAENISDSGPTAVMTAYKGKQLVVVFSRQDGVVTAEVGSVPKIRYRFKESEAMLPLKRIIPVDSTIQINKKY